MIWILFLYKGWFWVSHKIIYGVWRDLQADIFKSIQHIGHVCKWLFLIDNGFPEVKTSLQPYRVLLNVYKCIFLNRRERSNNYLSHFFRLPQNEESLENRKRKKTLSVSILAFISCRETRVMLAGGAKGLWGEEKWSKI